MQLFGVTLTHAADVRKLVTVDDLSLRAICAPAMMPEPRGTILVLNGRSEFLEKYAAVFEALHQRGFAYASLDWRGQGLSERLLGCRLPGYVPDFSDYAHDLDAICNLMQGMPRPWVVLAHSMGGCILTQYLMRDHHPFDAAILSAPMFGLAVPWFAKPILRQIARCMVWLGYGERYVQSCSDSSIAQYPFKNNVLSSNQTEFERYAQYVRDYPELGLGGATWQWLQAAFQAVNTIDHAPRDSMTIPMLIAQAGRDAVVDNRRIARFVARQTRVQSVTLDGSRHEPLIETPEIQATLWQAIDGFLNQIAPVAHKV